ncbi:MAG: D-alanyl-D-alanine carboxypeptidase [Desulfovibrio sp.]|jgi:D-alanyl-D-alanine carboxypeptidase (penicillin-binding protein 5/6)|nr:D-alanyl-D-alanine carboxypeptidase [Desulfovibrio sp.]
MIYPARKPLAQLLCLLTLSLFIAAQRANATTEPFDLLGVNAAILFDSDNGAILFEQNADERIPPASLTKILSMFLAFDHIRAGRATLDSEVVVSRDAAHAGGSRMGLKKGRRVRLRELLLGMAVSSGNDASVAVAEFVGGSVPAFVNMMNAKAKKLGMADSYFCNPNGLPDPAQRTTARDMLTLARAYLRAHPEAMRYHNTPALNFRGQVTWNKNPLLGQYAGVDGLKSGWIRDSGYNLIFTASRANKRLLAVTLGAPSARARGAEACRLLDAGFLVRNNQAVSVAAALHKMPSPVFRLDLQKNAQEAGRLYAQAQARTRIQPQPGAQAKARKQAVRAPKNGKQAARKNKTKK